MHVMIAGPWAWDFDKKGIFSVKSCYRMLTATVQRRKDRWNGRASTSNSEATANGWRSLWKTMMPGKIRHFLWRLGRQSIPTEDVRKHRKMATSDECQMCGMIDSWRHSLIECSSSRCVWALADDELLDHMVVTTERGAFQWLLTMINSVKHDEFIQMAVTLWAIWHARRKLIHEGKTQSPYETYMFIKRFLA